MAEVVSIKPPSQPASTRGRPPFRPTLTQRDRVEIMAAAGLSHRDISTAMQISRPTLEVHFPRELRYGAALQMCKALRLLRQAAKRGSVPAMWRIIQLCQRAMDRQEERKRPRAEGGWGSDDGRPGK